MFLRRQFLSNWFVFEGAWYSLKYPCAHREEFNSFLSPRMHHDHVCNSVRAAQWLWNERCRVKILKKFLAELHSFPKYKIQTIVNTWWMIIYISQPILHAMASKFHVWLLLPRSLPPQKRNGWTGKLTTSLQFLRKWKLLLPLVIHDSFYEAPFSQSI